MRSMYSASSFGTHHIFFPPRLQVVPGKNSPGGLALDLLHYSALLGLTRHETDRPAGVPVGRRAADHRDNRALLRVVQHPVGHRAGLVSEGRFQSPLEV